MNKTTNKNTDHNIAQIAYPGKYLGSEEEYEPGEGTYTKDGEIYSELFGIIKVENKKIFVQAKRPLVDFYIGQKVIGRVEMIIEPIALVKVITKTSENKRFSYQTQSFILKIENIKNGFVKKVSDEYKVGDIIKAKIIELKNGEYHLSTKDEDCGVIKAYNSSPLYPRYPLTKTPNSLIDLKTNTKEYRKVSSDYLLKI
ncbi:MAG: exosome complex RNA-binding protein Csl4 [Candidatus Anstonellaceae archaeon]